jgi:class 3 adenylate cyclase
MTAAHKVLIVDTEAAHTQPLRRELQGLGIEVTHAWDLDQVRTRRTDSPPSLVVIDPWAFGAEGPAFLDDFYTRWSAAEVPALVISGTVDAETKRRLFDHGISDFFTKPVDYTALGLRIRRTLEARDTAQQIQELNRKLERERNILARYFSHDMVEMLLNEEISTDFGGSYETVTVLVFDLRGSTALAETLDPAVLSELLSEIFTDVMDLIYGNKGSVNKLLGDGILATYGVPVSPGDDAYRAARTALQILEYLDTFNELRPPFLEAPISAGVGIATGEVFVGNIGSVRRMEYTVLGDAVNAAARLESETKQRDCNILIDARTRTALGDLASTEDIGATTLAGRAEPIQAYSLIDLDAEEVTAS